jgi:hypothetical protein
MDSKNIGHARVQIRSIKPSHHSAPLQDLLLHCDRAAATRARQQICDHFLCLCLLPFSKNAQAQNQGAPDTAGSCSAQAGAASHQPQQWPPVRTDGAAADVVVCHPLSLPLVQAFRSDVCLSLKVLHRDSTALGRGFSALVSRETSQTLAGRSIAGCFQSPESDPIHAKAANKTNL